MSSSEIYSSLDSYTYGDSSTTTTVTTSTTNNNAMKKVWSKKDLKNDPARFENPGLNFNAKVIGIDNVPSPRGDKMCQESMHKLKVAIKISGVHKQKIVINVSLEGVKIIDVRTQAVQHTHAVHKISFISRDMTDSRAFGYVYGVGDGTHKFFAIKTEKAAENLVLSLRDLFQVVFEMKKKEMVEAKKKQEDEKAVESTPENTSTEDVEEPIYQVPMKNKKTGDQTSPVPTNDATSKPEEATSNLVDLENELETIEQGIEQMNTLESMFDLKVDHASSSQSLPTPDPWGASGMQTQAETTSSSSSVLFSIGDPFAAPAATTSSSSSVLFSIGDPFAAPAAANQLPFSQPAFGQSAFSQPAFGQPAFSQPPPVGMFTPFPASAAASPFPFPTVPPRTGLPFQAAHTAFPGIPAQQNQQKSIILPVTSDPFADDPFALPNVNSAQQNVGPGLGFGDVLMPSVTKQQEVKQEAQNKPKDIFDDLVDIGTTNKVSKTPKDLFAEMKQPPKRSLNELKTNKVTELAPAKGALQQQASDPVQSTESKTDFSLFGESSDDPFNTSFEKHNSTTVSNNNPATPPLPWCRDFVTPDPFDVKLQTATSTFSRENVFGDDSFDLPSPDEPPPPLPSCNLVSDNLYQAPSPPPRPCTELSPSVIQNIPPAPPPRSKTCSVAYDTRNSQRSSESRADSTEFNCGTPTLPPRQNNQSSSPSYVPRPRPRKSVLSSSKDTNGENIETQNDFPLKLEVNAVKTNSTRQERTLSSSVIHDPFQTSDPFASVDPFSASDPFASDPFASDPFSPKSALSTQYTNDPFIGTSANLPSTPKHNGTSADVDPFTVFDKAFNADPFNFEKVSSSKSNKVKLKPPSG
ncbi:hypothetical protein ACJMK2_042533 [Sinanodonta woodiana]|uniref:PID domain-containing protein n=1 Tax=Sinanodonta woodiana TaxID=1069815 RepID=A0ABD3W8Q1_SINWO